MVQAIQKKTLSPIRSEIQRIINSIVPFDSKENEHLNFTKHWLETGADLFRTTKPATPDPHLVAYFLLVDLNTNKVLLTDHKKSGLWLPTGGHVEINEHPKDTVKREIIEELEIEAIFLSHDPLFLTVTKTVGQTAGHTDVSLWYILKGFSFDTLNYDKNEFHQINWFCQAEIPYQQSDPHMNRCIKKLIHFNILKDD
ncbi:MAG: NUDIX domain-containing protein [Chlamydiales bacterium]|nr:NUDIX domain-containing protein [Chlamydiales bacterium]